MKKIFLSLLALCALMLFVPSCKEPNEPEIPETPGDTVPEEPGFTFTDSIVFNFNGVSFCLIKVEGGYFYMGAQAGQDDARPDAAHPHSVLVDDYYIGQTEVTQALWEAMMGSNPATDKGDNCPAQFISWEDCQEFITRLNDMLMEEIFAGNIPETELQFRMPTEAEWEYAAMGGKNTHYYYYSGSNDIDSVAWYDYIGRGFSAAQPVAQKKANELGLYDMSGNVYEWCSDFYDEEYYKSNENNNPKGPSEGTHHVRRGGSWHSFAFDCRYNTRSFEIPAYKHNDTGLRLVLGK